MKTLFKIGNYICIGLLLSSCSKSNVNPNEELSDGVSTVISDLAGDVDAYVGNGSAGNGNPKETRDFHTFLFRFSDKKQTWLKNKADSNANFSKTDWDIAFSGQYNSTLYVNDGTVNSTPAFGNGSKHKIVLVKQAYDQVTTAPSDADFEQKVSMVSV